MMTWRKSRPLESSEAEGQSLAGRLFWVMSMTTNSVWMWVRASIRYWPLKEMSRVSPEILAASLFRLSPRSLLSELISMQSSSVLNLAVTMLLFSRVSRKEARVACSRLLRSTITEVAPSCGMMRL